jgi:hypothetical protein
MSNAITVHPFRNNLTTPPASSIACGRNWRRRARAGMMLALSLCFGGCAHGPGSPSVAGTAGNAVLMVLPAGTTLVLPDKEASDMTRKLFVNELNPSPYPSPRPTGRGDQLGATNTLPGRGAGNGGEALWAESPRLVLSKPLRLASPGYITDRDLRELELLQRIEELQVENQALRGK